MPNNDQRTKPWLTVDEIAESFGCPVEEIEVLARRNNWPSVQGSHGAKFAVEPEDVKKAMADAS
ncbi:hypothetical protein MKK55_13025 [Methylobacterium sp. J-059]|uniref:hypothetical protein n=1 Tax=Methylobacterium sp. J-059 TaxID=2836643 RepID=UPI001FB8665F|nr:hypothetical protein [Methylobacterium sp. J-059]MCJ2039852.1 hypothetical protein [Methylobacterium sp. J-059]